VIPSRPHSVGRTNTGALVATGQGRALSTAPKARTLEAAPIAGNNRGQNSQSIDIAQLKRGVSLGMVLSRYGIFSELKRVGSQLAGRCPIHDGNNPRQFVVHLASNNWFCFGDCNRGGSMLDFIALKERVSIPRATQLVAEWFALTPSPSTRRHQQQRRKSMSPTKPSHRVYVVEDNREGAETTDQQAGFWTRIGAAWPHKDGRGLNVVLSALPVGNRMVLREYTEEDEAVDKKRGKSK